MIAVLRIIFSELGSKLTLWTIVTRVLVSEKKKDDLGSYGRMAVQGAEEEQGLWLFKKSVSIYYLKMNFD